jgi:hypothetical protein
MKRSIALLKDGWNWLRENLINSQNLVYNLNEQQLNCLEVVLIPVLNCPINYLIIVICS